MLTLNISVMSTIQKEQSKLANSVEVALLFICFVAVISYSYTYITADSFEDTRASFALSLDAWDKQMASTGR